MRVPVEGSRGGRFVARASRHEISSGEAPKGNDRTPAPPWPSALGEPLGPGSLAGVEADRPHR